MDTNEMIALLLPPNGCFACSDTRKEIAEELARRSVDLERECADADKICAALGLTVDKSRTEGGSLNVPRIVGHIQETLTALRESHAFGVAMSDKYVASRAPERAAAPVAWMVGDDPDSAATYNRSKREDAYDAARRWRCGITALTTVPGAPELAPAQAEPQEGDLLHTMMEWARTEEGRKQLADSYRPHLWACAKRVADPQNEAATCRHWCGNIEHCQPIASAPAQPDDQMCVHGTHIRERCGQCEPAPAEDALPEFDPTRPRREQGLYRKFNVSRVDGSDAPGGKHYGCEYFVLDRTHDKYAAAALRAYATACAEEYPTLAADLMRGIDQPAPAEDDAPVRRFACFTQEDGVYESKTGEHVLYSDYANLAARLAALRCGSKT